MKNLKYIILLLLLPVLWSCSNEDGAPDYQEDITVFGYLFVDEAVTADNAIFVGRTLPINEFYEENDAAISDALVTIQKDGAARVDTLREPDPIAKPGFYSNPDLIIEELTIYHLTVRTGEKVVTAQTMTPYRLQMVEEPTVMPGTMVFEDIPDSNRVTFRCADPTEEQVCLVDVYCLEDYQNARYIYEFNGHEYPDDEDEYEGGDSGEPRNIIGYLRLKHFDEEAGTYVFDWYGAMFAFYGRYELGFYTIDDNYYNFLYREHPELNGGVTGGIGVFGSASRSVYTVKIVEE